MKVSRTLQWIFAALFLLCGIPLLFLDRDNPDPAAAQLLAGTAALFLGGFGVCLAWSAWEVGAIKLQHVNYTRAGEPRRFMATVAMIFLAGCGTLASAVWFFFFK